MLDRRKDDRGSPTQKLWVKDKTTHQVIGCIENLTTNGFMLTSDQRIEPYTMLECLIELPREIRGDSTIVFNAQSVWSRQMGTSGEYQVGFVLLGVDPDEKIKIECLLEADLVSRRETLQHTGRGITSPDGTSINVRDN